MAAKVKKTAVRRGVKAITDRAERGESAFLAIPADSTVDIIPLIDMEEMVSIDQHAIWLDGGNSPIFACIDGTGETCPGCALGDKPKFRGFLPVLVKEDGKTAQKIFSFGIQVARSLAEIDDAIDGIKGQILRVKRSGSGMSTRWTVITTGKTKDVGTETVEDVEDHLGPTERAGILELLYKADIDLRSVWTDAEEKALTGSKPKAEEPKAEKAEETPDVEGDGDTWDEV